MYISIALLFGLITGTILGTTIVVKLIQHHLKNRVEKGDIVLYVNPASPPEERNLVTLVMNVFPEHGTAIIRAIRTTMVVSQKHLQILEPDRSFPLQIPKKPQAEATLPNDGEHFRYVTFFEGDPLPSGSDGICSPGNRAEFTPIPLNWVEYGIGLDDAGKLRTNL